MAQMQTWRNYRRGRNGDVLVLRTGVPNPFPQRDEISSLPCSVGTMISRWEAVQFLALLRPIPTLLFLLVVTEIATAFTMIPSSINEIKLTWETAVEEQIRSVVASTPHVDRPFMVSVVGIPGSGKTTSARLLTELLNDVGCMFMPFDGYHYPHSTLETFENAHDVIYRRGAPDTFDAARLELDLRRIREGDEPIVYVPGFDHAKGDPQENEHSFRRAEHKVVVCEGLYLLHDANGWENIPSMFDCAVFVDADIDVCMDRLKIRNLCIPGYTPDEIRTRVDKVDRINAETVIRSKERANIIVASVAF